ncbi:ABC transporter substrate-binding protein [Salipaludibacillus sp. HK11]|uniref:ABC transporter substrate-binding protein n=1 Tax=Salipaludibacillus sp. HK11 TaxID=3394320 RepID=UPI0039FD197E
MRKDLLVSIVSLSSLILFAGCASNDSDASNNSNENTNSEITNNNATEEEETVTIQLFNNKVEIHDELLDLAREYQSENSHVRIEIESLSADDYPSQLTTKFSAGESPDIFRVLGHSGLETWVEYLEDLSDQPWVDNMIESTKPAATFDDKIYGMPLGIEGLGYIYNKDLFDEAGITEVPTTFTEMEEAVAKLNEAGISPFVSSFAETFNPGFFATNNAFAKQEDPSAFMEGLSEGTASFTDNEIFNQWLDLIDLEIDNAHKDPMSIGYSEQVTDFATEQGAITLSTNSLQSLLDEINPDLNLGMMPMPLNDDEHLNDRLFSNVPFYWGIHNESEVKEEAKEFLTWLSMSEAGERYITEEFKHIPPFTTMEADSELIGPLANDVQQYANEKPSLALEWNKFPTGLAPQLGSALQKYVSYESDREELLAEFQRLWDSMKDQ